MMLVCLFRLMICSDLSDDDYDLSNGLSNYSFLSAFVLILTDVVIVCSDSSDECLILSNDCLLVLLMFVCLMCCL